MEHIQSYKEAFVCGDVHGCLSELKELIKGIDRETTRIILCGDLVDRGPDSEGVIDFVRENNIECVRGNHEEMMIECFPYIEALDATWALGGSDWYLNGGHDVLTQYSSRDKLLKDIKWLSTLPLYIETGIKNSDGLELLVSHTWVSQYKDIEKESKTFNFVWARNQPTMPFETKYYNVFGHTPVDHLKRSSYSLDTDTKPIKYTYGCNIDTGAPYNREGAGVLSGIFFPSLEVKQVRRID